MKRILVPTDFSECSYHAAEVAAGIAKKTGARIFLLHALDIQSYSRNDGFTEASNTAEMLFLLKQIKMHFKKMVGQDFFEGVDLGEVLQMENVYETITSEAAEHGVDMIVMGSHGSSGPREYFVGSNTERVIRMADCPVLTIKEKSPDFSPKNIVFASDFSKEGEKSFSKIHQITQLFNARVHLVKIITPGNFEPTYYSEKLINDFAENVGLEDFTVNVYNETLVERGVNKFAMKINADLLAMETHGRTGIIHLLKGSLAEDVANHSSLPVLTTKINRAHVEQGAIFPS
jgi:nucleotide-binding universal stress UspA family protein